MNIKKYIFYIKQTPPVEKQTTCSALNYEERGYYAIKSTPRTITISDSQLTSIN